MEPDRHLATHDDYRNLQGPWRHRPGSYITKFGPIAPDTVFQAMARRDQYMQNLSSRLPELHAHVLPEVRLDLLDDDVHMHRMMNLFKVVDFYP